LFTQHQSLALLDGSHFSTAGQSFSIRQHSLAFQLILTQTKMSKKPLIAFPLNS